MAITRRKASILVVIIGATLSITSVFIYNQIIDKNYSKIHTLENSVIEKEDLIKEVWQNTLALESKKDVLLLMVLLNENEKPYLNEYIKDAMSTSGLKIENIPQNTDEAFSLLTEEIGKKRHKSHEQIDDTYFEKLDLQDKIYKIKRENEKYAILALLLQVIGLIFILCKDIVYLR